MKPEFPTEGGSGPVPTGGAGQSGVPEREEAEVRFVPLDASHTVQRRAWLDLWERWPDREVSAHPSYAELFAVPGDQVWCAALDAGNGGILFPLLLRPLAREPWAPAGCEWWDATSPYGYGGPYCWNCDSAAVAGFWAGLRRWARERQVVSLIARLSVFPEQLAEFDGEVVDIMPNVVRSLESDPEVMWRDYKHELRRSIRWAAQNGVVVEMDPHGARLDEFMDLYHATMERRGATAFYRFPRSFFERIISELPGQFMFFHALHEGKCVANELTLVSGRHLYSFLGGKNELGRRLDANSLLLHEIAMWGGRIGKQHYILGGGYGEADSIFSFKLQFAPRGVVPFRIGQMVFDPPACEALVNARRAWETAHGRVWEPRPRFFPPYRA